MTAIKFNKVTVLPGTLDPHTFYFVNNGTFSESYLTDSTGTAKSIGNSSMIEAVAQPLIDAAISANADNGITLVADIAARDAASSSYSTNRLVLVQDASADVSVTSGAALYFWDETGGVFIKVSEYESMDITFDWANIQNKPTSAVALIDDAVTKRHTHANQATLDLLGDNAGALTYNGAEIANNWSTTNW